MLPGKTYKPEEFLQILRKRIWLVAVPWALVAAGTAGFARLLPDEYQAVAMIQVVPPRVPDTIMKASTTATLTDRLRATEATILSRTRLEHLVKEFNLYPDRQKTEIMEDIVARMRRDIKTAPLKGDVFQVQYTGRNPVTVMKVTERLASLFLEESLKDGQRRAEGTSSFVDAEVEEKHRQLLEMEERLTNYRVKNSGELPTQVGSNMSAVSSLQTQLQQNSLNLNQDNSRRLFLERTIADLESQSDPVTTVGATSTDPTTMKGSAAQKLAAAQAGLDGAIARGVKPTHIDYQRWERLVAQYKKEADAEALRTTSLGPAGTGSAAASLSPREKALLGYREELEALKVNIAAKEEQDKKLRARALEYQSKVDRSPLREAELTEIQREYDTIRGIYDGLVAKREAASMSVNLNRRQIGEQFVLLDPAQVPQRPSSPNRMAINSAGLIAGLVLGLGLVMLLEYRDSTFKTDSELGGALALPVLAVVPLMLSEAERRSKFRRRLILNLGLGSTVAVCLAVITYSFVFLR
jgi:polysaccharide chain length determinant protein (PEP-CTERM system associated)